ncbi:MAG: glycosyltransferase [Lachnospiraceae bacterium]|nr:glycosyltransferase [Lachnospiraceae bacterium]
MKIQVLLSSYNGEKYIREQIDTILDQDITESAELELLVRDDGSTDSTHDILDEYKRAGSLKWYTGDNLRTARSFWNLLNEAGEADYYAFADQDDHWFGDKLSRAVRRLEDEKKRLAERKTNRKPNSGEIPLLYFSTVVTTDEGLNPIDVGVSKLNRYTDFYHSLIYSTTQGCTFVFNREARDIMLKYHMGQDCREMHDWLAHKIVAMFGKVILDTEPSMYYRQHSGNVIGAKRLDGFGGVISRLKGFMSGGSIHVRSSNARGLYKTYAELIKDEPHKYKALRQLAYYRKDRRLKAQLIRNKAFRVGGINDLFFLTLVILKLL